jgi:replicative DNA helicase
MNLNNKLNEEMYPIFCNEQAEQAVIGAIVLESTAFSEICSILTSEMFSIHKHELMFKSVCDLYDKGEKIDMISITERLRKDGILDEIGGSAHIAEISASVLSSAHIKYHACLVQQMYYRRKVYEVGQKTQMLAANQTNDIADVIDSINSEMESITEKAYKLEDDAQLCDSAYLAFKEYFIREKSAKEGVIVGVDTGISRFNQLSGGWQNSNLIIIAARPSMGKTSIMLYMAKKAAMSGKNVFIFSLEMSNRELSDKFILSASDVNTIKFKNGTLSEDEVKVMESGANSILTLPIFINDCCDLTVRQLRNTAKLMQKQHKCDIVFIDYLQLINMRHENRQYNREQEVSQTSRALKIMAKELDIPVIVLSQLSRNCEERKDKRPLLSDLRESGAIEQDADIVMFLWRPEYYNIPTYENKFTKGLMIMDIAKGRNLPTCEIEVIYNEQMTRFWDPNEE